MKYARRYEKYFYKYMILNLKKSFLGYITLMQKVIT